MSWLACELHCHTVHSDGCFQPRELQQAAKDNALSLIALTDHNTFSGAEEMDNTLLPFIKGIEWTTYFGHMLVLGAKRFVDWRDAAPDTIDEKIKAVKAAGALVGIAHPFQLGSPMCTGGRWEFRVNHWEQADYIEIWHDRYYNGSDENEKALAFWTSLLDRGYHLAAAYGKDWHRPTQDGHYACTYLNIDGAVNEENALRAIQNGKTVVSTGAKFFFTATQNGTVYTVGDTLSADKTVFDFYTDVYARSRLNGGRIVHESIRIVTNGGKTVAEYPVSESRARVLLEPAHWYRAELWGLFEGQPALLAVTSPLYT